MGIFDKNSFKGSNGGKLALDIIDGVLFVASGAWLIKLFKKKGK